VDDQELFDRFSKRTLDTFPHEDHVRLLYVATLRLGAREALSFARDGLQAMAAAKGRPEVYHETRTVAWSSMISAAALERPYSGFDAFSAAHPELLRRDYLGDFYSSDLLGSDEARSGFVEPDLRPLSARSDG
jgi:hypothetical protein